MHLYVVARGIVRNIKEWANELGHQYCKFQIKDNKTGNISNHFAAVQVRKIELYEIVFPKTAEAEMMGIINPSEYKVLGKWTNKLKALTRMMGLKKCLPREKWKTPMLPMQNRDISILPLGIKEDKINWEVPKNMEVHANDMTPQEEI